MFMLMSTYCIKLQKKKKSVLLGVYPWPFPNTKTLQGSQFYSTVDDGQLIFI